MNERLEHALALIDAVNSEDPQREQWQGHEYPSMFLYGQRMNAWLHKLTPEPSEASQIAARAQHIRRWQVPRDTYSKTREGYLAWRSYLYRFHAEQTAQLLEEIDYPAGIVAQVRKNLLKQGIKRDNDVQLVEDAACLVFLEFDLPAFAQHHDAEKLISIIKKTWRKMSDSGHELALQMAFPAEIKALIEKALSADNNQGNRAI